MPSGILWGSRAGDEGHNLRQALWLHHREGNLSRVGFEEVFLLNASAVAPGDRFRILNTTWNYVTSLAQMLGHLILQAGIGIVTKSHMPAIYPDIGIHIEALGIQ
jgi:hypothetical protein